MKKSLLSPILALALFPCMASAAVTIVTTSVTDHGTSSPSINLTSEGTTDWLVIDRSGAGNTPAVRDQKSGGSVLSLVGSSGVSGGGEGTYFDYSWSDGTNAAIGSYGGYWMFNSNNPATVTFSASIGAGETSTVNFHLLAWHFGTEANLAVLDSSNTLLATLTPTPFVYDGRHTLSISYSATTAELLSFEFSLPSGVDRALAVSAVSLSTIPEPSAFVFLAGAFGLGLALLRRRRVA